MPVHFDYVPTAGFPFVGQWFERHDLMNWAIKLNIVIVQNGGQVGEMVLRRSDRALPDDTRLALAIAQ